MKGFYPEDPFSRRGFKGPFAGDLTDTYNQIWREIHPNHPEFSHNFPKA